MDIFTPKGLESREHERAAIELFHACNPSLQFIETPKGQPAIVDGFIAENNVITAVVETKCRVVTANMFFDTYRGEWLVTRDKIDAASMMARQLCVPLVGFLYLVPDRMLLMKTIWSNAGFCKMHGAVTATSATVNGGTALRANLYIDMNDAVEYTAPE